MIVFHEKKVWDQDSHKNARNLVDSDVMSDRREDVG